MTTRAVAALPLLLFAIAGCVEESQRGLLVPPGSVTPPVTALRPVFSGPRIPEHEASARRLLAVGEKVIAANPQAGLRPAFIPVGFPHPEICHGGGGIHGYQITVSDGLVDACKTDAALAAVIALEMGKIVAERESAAGPSLRQPEKSPPPDVAIGSDSGGTFGPPDGTRVMELAQREPKRRSDWTAPKLSPETLAKGYLKKAGYDPAALAEVGPLLRKADGHSEMEKAVKTAELGAPVAVKRDAAAEPKPK